MSREIKFRAWDKVNERMGYFYPGFSWNDEYEIWHLSEVDNQGFRAAAVPCKDNIVLMQYTGLKDKNGKEIYEGDILELVQEPGLLRKYGPSYSVMQWNGDVAAWTRFHPLNRFIVVGNIHENPELLKQAA